MLNLLKKIVKYPFISTKIDERWITSFSDWFGSISGFKQQTFIMIGWVGIVLGMPLLDPNMFHLMAFLTIYSAVTQPILAFGNTRSNNYMLRLLQNSIHQMEAMMDVIGNQQRTIDKLNKVMSQVAEDVEELQEEEKNNK